MGDFKVSLENVNSLKCSICKGLQMVSRVGFEPPIVA